jgi:hypothetical protein
VAKGQRDLSERIPCEFCLVRYVPDVVKGEFTNIGVLLRKASQTPGRGSTLVRFTRDWSRVRCVDSDADIALLEALEAEMISLLKSEAVRSSGSPSEGSKTLLQTLADTLSNSIQITEPAACLAESLALELEQLMRLYVEPLRVKLARRRTGRAAIAGAMRSEFERAGVWEAMRKRIAASLYTSAGDPMKIDCGYRPNGVIRMFHAVSLEADVEAAKGLAYSAPRLREGVTRVERANLELTAVVEPLRAVSEEDSESEAADRYRFGVEAMEREKIRVITVKDLARAAETARVELRM